MSEEIDKHVLRKYEIVSKLGKGVSARRLRIPCGPQGRVRTTPGPGADPVAGAAGGAGRPEVRRAVHAAPRAVKRRRFMLPLAVQRAAGGVAGCHVCACEPLTVFPSGSAGWALGSCAMCRTLQAYGIVWKAIDKKTRCPARA